MRIFRALQFPSSARSTHLPQRRIIRQHAVSFQLSLNTEPVTAAYPTDPLLVSPESSVGEAVRLIKAHRKGSVLVCQDHRLQGIFTERDALKWMASGKSADESVVDWMSSELHSLPATATVGEAIRLMSEGGYRRMPIVGDDGKAIGLAAVQGIVHYLVDHFPQTIYTLPPQPGSVPSEREGA